MYTKSYPKSGNRLLDFPDDVPSFVSVLSSFFFSSAFQSGVKNKKVILKLLAIFTYL